MRARGYYNNATGVPDVVSNCNKTLFSVRFEVICAETISRYKLGCFRTLNAFSDAAGPTVLSIGSKVSKLCWGNPEAFLHRNMRGGLPFLNLNERRSLKMETLIYSSGTKRAVNASCTEKSVTLEQTWIRERLDGTTLQGLDEYASTWARKIRWGWGRQD